MRIKNNVKSEGISTGTFPEPGLAEFGAISFGSAFGEGAESGGNSGDKLPPSSGSAGGRVDSSNSGDETPKKRRGRPPGVTGKSAAKPALSADKLADARRKFISTLAGGVGFGFSWYGVQRANKYRKFSPVLAQRVYTCYLVPQTECEGVAEPVADAFIAWFPQFVEPVCKGIDPALAIARIIAVLQQTSDNEKFTVEKFQQEITPPQPSTNGNTPPVDFAEDNPPESPIDEWMTDQGQSTEEILTANIPVAA